MTEKAIQPELCQRYVLGELTEAEQLALERVYFADPERFEEICAAENDLIDQYVRGQLSPQQRERFETHFLAVPEHQERVLAAQTILRAADSYQPTLATQEGKRQETTKPVAAWWEPVKAWFQVRSLLQPGLAFAALCLVGLTFWLWFERTRLQLELTQASHSQNSATKREQELAAQLAMEKARNDQLTAQISQTVTSPTPPQSLPSNKPGSTFAFLLSPLLVRSGATPQRIVPPQNTAEIRLQMKIVPDPAVESYQVTVRTVEGATILTQRNLRVRSNQTLLSLTVPTSKLAPNGYLLTLEAVTAAGDVEELNRYFFRLAPPKN